jgi:lysozyme
MADYKNLEARIKVHEGFRNTVYLDSLNHKTIGWGHLCTKDEIWEEGKEYSEEELHRVFITDLNRAIDGANKLCHDIELPDLAKECIVEMVFQLGAGGVSKFKKMWKFLREGKFFDASCEMLDSRWAKQTPNRAHELSELMKKNEKNNA